MKELNVNSDEIIMIGDNPKADFIGAKQSNIKFAFAKYGSTFKEPEDTDYTLNTFSDILKIID